MAFKIVPPLIVLGLLSTRFLSISLLCIFFNYMVLPHIPFLLLLENLLKWIGLCPVPCFFRHGSSVWIFNPIVLENTCYACLCAFANSCSWCWIWWLSCLTENGVRRLSVLTIIRLMLVWFHSSSWENA